MELVVIFVFLLRFSQSYHNVKLIDNLLKCYLQTRISPPESPVKEILAWLYYTEPRNVLAVNAVHCVSMVLFVPLLSYIKMFTLHWMNK